MTGLVVVLVAAACASGGSARLVATTPVPSTVAATTLAPTTTTVAVTTTVAATTTTTLPPSTTVPPTTTTVAPTTLAPAVPVAATTATFPTTTTPLVPLTTEPLVIDEDVAALPDGNGARIAIVVDDAGGVEGSLADYLALPLPLTVAVIPTFDHATSHAERAHAAGKEVILHLPLSNHVDHGDGVTRLAGTETPEVVDAFVQAAVDRVPYAIGANNHEGSFGSTLPELMRPLLASLQKRGLFFLDSVTTQRSVGYAVEGELGMDKRVNNQFLEPELTDENSRVAVLHLALLASKSGSGIGICHVYHPYALHALQAVAAQLRARGYVFVPLSQVTNHLQGGLDAGMKATVPSA